MEKNSKKKHKLHVRKGDTVKVISGNSKGKTGKIVTVLVEENRAVVEGINMISKHIKPSAENPKGGIDKREAPIHISNLMLVDPANGQPTKVGRKPDENGKLQRYSKKTGEIIKNG
jgi:large subunit ribosomal protein L24